MRTPSLLSAKRSAASCSELGPLLMLAPICLCEAAYRATPFTDAMLYVLWPNTEAHVALKR